MKRYTKIIGLVLTVVLLQAQSLNAAFPAFADSAKRLWHYGRTVDVTAYIPESVKKTGRNLAQRWSQQSPQAKLAMKLAAAAGTLFAGYKIWNYWSGVQEKASADAKAKEAASQSVTSSSTTGTAQQPAPIELDLTKAKASSASSQQPQVAPLPTVDPHATQRIRENNDSALGKQEANNEIDAIRQQRQITAVVTPAQAAPRTSLLPVPAAALAAGFIATGKPTSTPAPAPADTSKYDAMVLPRELLPPAPLLAEHAVAANQNPLAEQVLVKKFEAAFDNASATAAQQPQPTPTAATSVVDRTVSGAVIAANSALLPAPRSQSRRSRSRTQNNRRRGPGAPVLPVFQGQQSLTPANSNYIQGQQLSQNPTGATAAAASVAKQDVQKVESASHSASSQQLVPTPAPTSVAATVVANGSASGAAIVARTAASAAVPQSQHNGHIQQKRPGKTALALPRHLQRRQAQVIHDNYTQQSQNSAGSSTPSASSAKATVYDSKSAAAAAADSADIEDEFEMVDRSGSNSLSSSFVQLEPRDEVGGLMQSLQDATVVGQNPSQKTERLIKLAQSFAGWKRQYDKIMQDAGIKETIKTNLDQLFKPVEKAYQQGPWVSGQQIVHSLLSAKDITATIGEYKEKYSKELQTNQQTKSYYKDAIAVTWYMYAVACNKYKPFREGMIQVKDPGQVLLKYLFMISAIEECDNIRVSTHFGSQPTTHYCIDVPGDMRDTDGWILPSGHYTILFAPTRNETVFIKTEKHGVNKARDIAHHTKDLLVSQVRKHTGGNDKPDYKKEHLLPKTIALCKKFLEQVVPKERSSKEVGSTVQSLIGASKKSRVAAIMRSLKQMSQIDGIIDQQIAIYTDLSPAQQTALRDLRKHLAEYDHIDKRTGDEAILDLNDLMPAPQVASSSSSSSSSSSAQSANSSSSGSSSSSSSSSSSAAPTPAPVKK